MGKMTTITNQWREMVVTVAVNGEPQGITAPVFGCFAVFDNGDEWALIHAPTGRRVHAYAKPLYAQQDVQQIAEKLQAEYGEAWNTESAKRASRLAFDCKGLWRDPYGKEIAG